MGPGPTPPLPNFLMVFRPSFAWQTPRRRPPADPSRAPALPKRGAGAAHARLSGAEQRRGGVPQSNSMVCGNVTHRAEGVGDAGADAATLTLTFFVLTMDKTGPHRVADELRGEDAGGAPHAGARAAAEDDRRPAQPGGLHDGASVDGGTAEGTSAVWKGAPQRELIVVQPQVA